MSIGHRVLHRRRRHPLLRSFHGIDLWFVILLICVQALGCGGGTTSGIQREPPGPSGASTGESASRGKGHVRAALAAWGSASGSGARNVEYVVAEVVAAAGSPDPVIEEALPLIDCGDDDTSFRALGMLKVLARDPRLSSESATPTVEVLVGHLRRPSRTTPAAENVAATLAAFGRFFGANRGAILDVVQSADPRVGIELLPSLVTAGVGDEEVIPLLTAWLREGGPETRESALDLMATLPLVLTRPARDAALAALSDEALDVPCAAMRVLARCEDLSRVETAAILGVTDPLEISTCLTAPAIDALSRAEAGPATRLLVSGWSEAGSEGKTIRISALSLRGIADGPAVDMVRVLTQDEDRWVGLCAGRALWSLTGDQAELLGCLRRFSDSDLPASGLQVVVSQLRGLSLTPELVGFLERAARHPDEAVRGEVARVVCTLQGDVRGLIRAWAEHADPRVRGTSAMAAAGLRQ